MRWLLTALKVIEKCIVDTDFANVDELLSSYSRLCQNVYSV